MAKQKGGRRGRRAPAQRFVSRSVLVWTAVAVIAVGAVAALAYWSRESAPCTPTGGHEHAAFGVFVHNESVTWTSPAFNFPRAGSLAGHIHQPASQTIHMESPRDCITLGSFFSRTLQSDLSANEIQLDTVVHDGATYSEGDGGQLRFFLGTPPPDWDPARGYLPPSAVEWTEVPDLSGHQPRDGQYLLVTFGDESDEAIRQQQLSIAVPNASEGGG